MLNVNFANGTVISSRTTARSTQPAERTGRGVRPATSSGIGVYVSTILSLFRLVLSRRTSDRSDGFELRRFGREAVDREKAGNCGEGEERHGRRSVRRGH